MRTTFTRSAAALVVITLAVLSSTALAAHPDKEDTYTITSIMQILQPVNPHDMNDDFQDARVIAQNKDSCLIEVTYYPLYQQPVEANANWRAEDAAMKDYLKPTPTENWDAQMRLDLIGQLHESGIDPDKLSDKELVEQVSTWAMRRGSRTNAFAIWTCFFQDGKPAIFPGLRDAFNAQKPNAQWTEQQTFDQELLGKSMFYAKVHGSCTSSSIYMATIMRALGIPTRIVFFVPPFDPSDAAQGRMFYDAVHHNQVRETVRDALASVDGFTNHIYDEVYVGHHWVRLNYNTLGQPILDRHYLGLMTHIYTCSDMSQVPLAQTWGMRYFHYPADQLKLSSANPYQLISVEDKFGSRSHIDNPPAGSAEYKTVTIDAIYAANSPALDPYIRDAAGKNRIDLFISYRERVDATRPMRAFYKVAGRKFVLRAAGHPPINAAWNGLTVSANGMETCALKIAADDKANIARGVAYAIEPANVSDTYRWVVAPGVTFTLP